MAAQGSDMENEGRQQAMNRQSLSSQHPSPKPSQAKLLAIVEVETQDAVQCQHLGCNHRVYKRIHVVEESGQLLVLGSSCFEKRYGSGALLAKPSYGGEHGKKLSAEERQMLVDNTAAFMERFRLEYEASKAAMLTKLQAMKASLSGLQPRTGLTPKPSGWYPSVKRPPWPWVKPLSSVAYFRLKDGTSWVRVQNTQGDQLLMPWPSFEGWDEAFPVSVGTPDRDTGGYRVKDIVYTVRYLRDRSEMDRVGIWSEVVP